MLNKNSKIGVSSRSFSKSRLLRSSLEEHFENIIYNEDLRHFNEEELISFFYDCEAVIVSEDIISKKIIDSLPNLKMVSKFGVGLDSIDINSLADTFMPKVLKAFNDMLFFISTKRCIG